MEEKRCIFHVPNYIDVHGRSGSQVRPLKIKKTLEGLGYEVDVVMGYGKERKKEIKRIKEKIRQGITYDFLYSESSTMPTLLTEKSHLPFYPNLDFGFWKFCKNNSIRIGLFYRDVIWKFEQYKKAVPWYMRLVTFVFYKYDLFKYNKLVDVLYLPSERLKKYVSECSRISMKVLPPGADYDENVIEKREDHYKRKTDEIINIFYVGGVYGIYDIIELVKKIREKNNVYMTICCKKEAWEQERERYSPFMTDRIKVIHSSGKELAKYYLEADICSCYFDIANHEYMKLATPIKLLEYISYVTPVIATKGSCAGDFVEKYDIGWSIPYNMESLDDLLERLIINKGEILEKQHNVINCLKDNTWEKRVMKVQKDLIKEKINNEAAATKQN